MIVRAPGKLVVTGAYAVLEGSPAIVCAVNRYAYASTEEREIDSRELYFKGTKLGLGSSAASLVARLGAAALLRGKDLGDASVRDAIFREARVEHSRAQGGGSGVDIAASAYGGVLRYTVGPSGPEPRTVRLPAGLVVEAFWSGASARTSDLRARVDALRGKDPAARAARMADLADAAQAGAAAIDAGYATGFVAAARRTLVALAALGDAADAPIVPSAFAELARVAEAHGAAFLPSGAGGGDVGVYVGTSAPPPEVLRRAFDLDMRPLGVEIDAGGLQISPSIQP